MMKTACKFYIFSVTFYHFIIAVLSEGEYKSTNVQSKIPLVPSSICGSEVKRSTLIPRALVLVPHSASFSDIRFQNYCKSCQRIWLLYLSLPIEFTLVGDAQSTNFKFKSIDFSNNQYSLPNRPKTHISLNRAKLIGMPVSTGTIKKPRPCPRAPCGHEESFSKMTSPGPNGTAPRNLGPRNNRAARHCIPVTFAVRAVIVFFFFCCFCAPLPRD